MLFGSRSLLTKLSKNQFINKISQNFNKLTTSTDQQQNLDNNSATEGADSHPASGPGTPTDEKGVNGEF